jgi:hypothetical protein
MGLYLLTHGDELMVIYMLLLKLAYENALKLDCI